MDEIRRHKYKATIQYVGTRFAGWQIQKNRVTVQGVIRDALTRLAGAPVTVVGAGRTDSGVHALGQVAHFFFPDKESIPDLAKTINAVLPWEIRVVRLQRVPLWFHAQKDAIRKHYAYRIYTGKVLPPFLHRQAVHIPQKLDLKAMQEAASLLLGCHDFTGFAAASTSVKNKVRTVQRSTISRRGCHWTYRVEAPGFLHHMVRNIVGTLLEVGQGKRPPGDITSILAAKDRKMAGPTAPAEGLYLVRIWYRNRRGAASPEKLKESADSVV